MKLTHTPELIHWPKSHYVFIEKTGPFQDSAPAAWQVLHEFLPELMKDYQIKHFCSLFQMQPKMIYRAGLVLEAAPVNLPKELEYCLFPGGDYNKFVLTGPYPQLGPAWEKVFKIVEEQSIPIRQNAFFIENYLNNPRTTPEAELQTEILLPALSD